VRLLLYKGKRLALIRSMMNQKRTLERATIVGFFSIPSPTLAEHNPTAYAAAMAGLPEGAGSCSHCGMGIRHHVVIRDEDGGERFIGCMCAEKVGVPKAREAIRYRMTTEQLAARDAKRAAEREAWQLAEQKRQDEEAARLATRRESVGHLVDMLRGLGNSFYSSLAEQLAFRPLSFRQAEYVAKATSATGRRNKRNAEAFDAVIDLCTTA
jgi:hypothetical protein